MLGIPVQDAQKMGLAMLGCPGEAFHRRLYKRWAMGPWRPEEVRDGWLEESLWEH